MRKMTQPGLTIAALLVFALLLAPCTVFGARECIDVEEHFGIELTPHTGDASLGRIQLGERDGQRYAFGEVVFEGLNGDELRLLRIQNEGAPQPTDTRIGPLPDRINSFDWDGDWLAVSLFGEDIIETTLFYDVSDLESPCLVSVETNVTELIDLDDGRAYFARRVDRDRTDMIVMTDLASPEKQVVLEGYVSRSIDNSRHIRLKTSATVSDGILYANTFEREGRVIDQSFAAFDLTDLESPNLLGESEIYGQPIYIVGDIAYVLRDDVGVRTYNVSNPSQIRIVGELQDNLPGHGIRTEPGGLVVDGSRMYAALWGGDWGLNNWRLRVADISDPAQPRELGRFERRDNILWGMWLQDDGLVMVERDALTILDVSDPANIVEVERYTDLFSEND